MIQICSVKLPSTQEMISNRAAAKVASRAANFPRLGQSLVEVLSFGDDFQVQTIFQNALGGACLAGFAGGGVGV